jgi:hypothetical protein
VRRGALLNIIKFTPHGKVQWKRSRHEEEEIVRVDTTANRNRRIDWVTRVQTCVHHTRAAARRTEGP